MFLRYSIGLREPSEILILASLYQRMTRSGKLTPFYMSLVQALKANALQP